MMWVYLAESTEYPAQRYVGHTLDLERRLAQHNEGDVPATALFRPWRLVVGLIFDQDARALEFEKFLKSAAGRTFAEDRLW